MKLQVSKAIGQSQEDRGSFLNKTSGLFPCLTVSTGRLLAAPTPELRRKRSSLFDYNVFFYAALALLLFACNTNQENPVISRLSMGQNDSTDRPADKTRPDPFRDSLKKYFECPVDFYRLKKETLDMHSGSSPDFKASYFHQTPDSTDRFYAYWAVEFDLRQSPVHRSLLFATWKPWQTAKQKYYETDNETLVGIQSRINWKGLRQSNFVGEKQATIENRFGTPHFTQENCSAYFQEDHLLILHFNKEKVDWFKYFRMNDSITGPESIPESFFRWNNS